MLKHPATPLVVVGFLLTALLITGTVMEKRKPRPAAQTPAVHTYL